MTMAEITSEITECPKCAAEVRPGSAFCYNCGGRVTEEVSEPIRDERPKVEEKTTHPAPGLKSARDVRRRERVFDREPRRIKWEPVEDTSNVQLVIFTVAVVIFTLVVMALVFYLR